MEKPFIRINYSNEIQGELMHKEKVVYAVYIKTTPNKIWEALTKSEFTRQYFWGVNVESDWNVGSKTRSFGDDGTTYSEGVILKSEKGKVLSQKTE